ncbi:MAG: preprotein translocase subunit SecE [Rickettsiales bacterium]|nr:MAG: preprotein translocase subunit SecE [Rickettsiales bacterium]
MLKKLKLYKFFDQVKQEAKKVVWPEKKELIASTSIVVIAVLVFSLVTMILDYGIHNLIRFLLNIGK